MSEDRANGVAVQARGLVKVYDGDVLAVNGIDLTIPTNTIYAMLGPNGAGKTTTFSVLTTLLEPTSGSASVLGYDVVSQANEVRKSIGVTFQETVLDQELTGRQALDYHGRLYRMGKEQRRARIGELLPLVELEEAADRLVSTYSQRLSSGRMAGLQGRPAPAMPGVAPRRPSIARPGARPEDSCRWKTATSSCRGSPSGLRADPATSAPQVLACRGANQLTLSAALA